MGSSHAPDRQLLDIVRNDKGVPTSELMTASVLVESTREHIESPRSRTNSNSTQTDDKPGVSTVSPKVVHEAAGGDVADGTVPFPSGDKPQVNVPDDDDDDCVVKCLYYTLQCCECRIM